MGEGVNLWIILVALSIYTIGCADTGAVGDTYYKTGQGGLRRQGNLKLWYFVGAGSLLGGAASSSESPCSMTQRVA